MEFGPQQITLLLLFAWFSLFLAGRYQQKRIKKALFDRVKTGIEPALKENPGLSLDAYYEWVFSDWEDLVRRNARFVLSDNELYPVSADPTRLQRRMNLTLIWLGAYLKLSGKELAMTDEQRTAVNGVVDSLSEARRQEFLDRQTLT
jgi:hypothetical protein